MIRSLMSLDVKPSQVAEIPVEISGGYRPTEKYRSNLVTGGEVIRRTGIRTLKMLPTVLGGLYGVFCYADARSERGKLERNGERIEDLGGQGFLTSDVLNVAVFTYGTP